MHLQITEMQNIFSSTHVFFPCCWCPPLSLLLCNTPVLSWSEPNCKSPLYFIPLLSKWHLLFRGWSPCVQPCSQGGDSDSLAEPRWAPTDSIQLIGSLSFMANWTSCKWQLRVKQLEVMLPLKLWDTFKFWPFLTNYTFNNLRERKDKLFTITSLNHVMLFIYSNIYFPFYLLISSFFSQHIITHKRNVSV